MPASAKPSLLCIVALCLVIAFAFLGSRAIWDPDEGRYSNVALTMLDTGDWLTPRRSEEVAHWTKPPGTYWLIAASVEAWGHTPWGARFPMALSFVICALLVSLSARRIAPGSERTAPIIFSTMVLPFVAGQLITTDFPLTTAQAVAMYGFVEYRFGPGDRREPWLLLMWLALGAGFMIKGPPALLSLLPVAALAALAPGKTVRPVWHLAGITLFLAIAAPWYVWVASRNPGLLSYFLGAEVVDRIASDRFDRNGQWYGWLVIYGPTLAFGTLPWTGCFWKWLTEKAAMGKRWRSPTQRQADAGQIFLLLWIALPLVVFCLAKSRLPLYVLPIFVPVAIAIAGQRMRMGHGALRWRWIAAWVVLLLCARVAGAQWQSHKDAAAWAQAITDRVSGPTREVIFVEDMARYGLHLHLGAEVEKVSKAPVQGSRFNPEYDESLMDEVREVTASSGHVFVAKQQDYPGIESLLGRHGFGTLACGAPYNGRVIFKVVPARPGLERRVGIAVTGGDTAPRPH